MKYYAIYDDDTFLFVGTLEECSKYLEVSISSVKFYTTPTYHRRNKEGIKIYKVED